MTPDETLVGLLASMKSTIRTVTQCEQGMVTAISSACELFLRFITLTALDHPVSTSINVWPLALSLKHLTFGLCSTKHLTWKTLPCDCMKKLDGLDCGGKRCLDGCMKFPCERAIINTPRSHLWLQFVF